ncbi:MAG: peptidylprolyl isomerase [Sphingorhabdus sp.]
MKISKRFSFSIAMLATAGLAPLGAQTVPDDGQPEARLNVPAGQTLFSANDPNVRRATAKVNGDIITGTDIDHRLALIVQANGGNLPASEVEKFRTRILANLIDETLQMQEAEAQEIGVSDKEVEDYFKSVAKQNYKRDPKEADIFLRSFGSSADSVKRQIKGELSWSRLLGRNITPFINVSEAEVKAIIDRINANRGKVEYHPGEIYLSATPENQKQVLANAGRILEQLRNGGSFAAYARQFSESSSAAQGGDLGWLFPEQLPATLAQALGKMRQGEVVVVPSPGGISLLALLDRRQVATSDPRDAMLSLKQISVNFPAGMTEKQALPKVQKFREDSAKVTGCGAADNMAQQLGAEVVNRDNIRIRDLPGPLQEVMQKLQIGQSTPPYGSLSEGVRVFVLCGRDEPKVADIDATKIATEIEDKRVGKRAQLYLRDLRRDAIIEYN